MYSNSKNYNDNNDDNDGDDNVKNNNRLKSFKIKQNKNSSILKMKSTVITN